MPSNSDMSMPSRATAHRSSLLAPKDQNRFAAASMRQQARRSRRSTIPHGIEQTGTPDARGASIRRRHHAFRMGLLDGNEMLDDGDNGNGNGEQNGNGTRNGVGLDGRGRRSSELDPLRVNLNNVMAAGGV